MEVRVLGEIPPWQWPAEAATSILEALRDRRAHRPDRLLAAELAGHLAVMNDDLAGALLGIVRSVAEDPALRARAAVSLGLLIEEMDIGFFDPDDVQVSEPVGRAVREGLREVYLDPAVPLEVRRRALEASARHREDWHPGAVRAAYHDDHPDWRLTAVFCMGFVPGFDGEIVETLESDDPELLFEALRAATRRAVEEAWPRVREILRSPDIDKPLLLQAIEAVATIRPDGAVAVLGDLMWDDDEEIAEAVHDALALAGPI